jgi:hypothetical protein
VNFGDHHEQNKGEDSAIFCFCARISPMTDLLADEAEDIDALALGRRIRRLRT